MAWKLGPQIQGKENAGTDGGGVAKRMSKDDVATNIVKAIRKAGQVPMPFQETPDGPAVLGYYVQSKELAGVKATVAIFRKTLNDTMASLGMRIYGFSTVSHRGSVHAAPAEWKDQRAVEITFPDGTATYAVFYPEVLWQRHFNPDPPLVTTHGGPNVPAVDSAFFVNRRFGR